MSMRPVNLTRLLTLFVSVSIGAAFLLVAIDRRDFVLAQETKKPSPAAKSVANAKIIARGKYIVVGVAGCGFCHSPHDNNGDPDRPKWLAGAPVFYQPAQSVPGWPTTAPRLAGLPPGSDADMITLLTTSVSRSGQPLRAPMPRFHMTRADAEAVVAYLKSLGDSR